MRISGKKKDKIFEQILAYLFQTNPKPAFTSHIAQEIARDEEFVKTLLLDLKKRNLVSEVKKNPKGVDYTKRSRWVLTDKVYTFYKEKQTLND